MNLARNYPLSIVTPGAGTDSRVTRARSGVDPLRPRTPTIIWDWNGTLFDDVDWCVACMNTMLRRRGLPVLASADAYRQIFGFPVIDYYRRAGLDLDDEPFASLAAEFMGLYRAVDGHTGLFPQAESLLADCRSAGLHQVILSASEQTDLARQTGLFGIAPYFDQILGISDIYAASKTDLGRAYIERTRPDSAVLIGDTTHDKEVADALGADCILVAAGHQTRAILGASGAYVVDSLADVRSALLPTRPAPRPPRPTGGL